MQVVCEATQSLDTQVRVAALQCLVKIMSLYYQYMEHYMGPALFAVRFGFLVRASDRPPMLYIACIFVYMVATFWQCLKSSHLLKNIACLSCMDCCSLCVQIVCSAAKASVPNASNMLGE